MEPRLHHWAGIFSVFKSFNCDMKIVTPCYKALPFLRVPCGIVNTEQSRTLATYQIISGYKGDQGAGDFLTSKSTPSMNKMGIFC